MAYVGTLSALVIVGAINADPIGRRRSGKSTDKKSLQLHGN